jgi:hypothetical protein
MRREGVAAGVSQSDGMSDRSAVDVADPGKGRRLVDSSAAASPEPHRQAQPRT